MKVKIATISNIVLEPYFKEILSEVINPCGGILYQSFMLSDILAERGKSHIYIADYVVVIIDFLEEYIDRLSNILTDNIEFNIENMISNETIHLFDVIKQLFHKNTKIIWFGYENYRSRNKYIFGHVCTEDQIVDHINITVKQFMPPETIFVDFKSLIAEVGVSHSYDYKSLYRWNAPYSKVLIRNIANEINKHYQINVGHTKKCLVLDCDNVLWGGNIAEVGINNILLGNSGFGKKFQDFQRFVLKLYQSGVIIAICSKNDFADIQTVFSEHSGMILKTEHIACFQVNWDNKPTNIKCISETLNISLDSIVFVDDSVFEIETVKALLPEVTAILYDRELSYDKFSCYNLKGDACFSNIHKRNETYKTNVLREKLKSECKDYSDYLQSLQMHIDIHIATRSEYARLSELTQRTNRCTNGKRYTVSEIEANETKSQVFLYSVSVSDRFSDLGIVGAIEVSGNCLTLFSLSCRALGRNIEEKMLEFVNKQHDVNKVILIPTKKNHEILTKLQTQIMNRKF